MKLLKMFFPVLFLSMSCYPVNAQDINVYINVRGSSGIEGKIKETMSRKFSALKNVAVKDNREECSLYLDLTVVEQEPIRFYALGVSVAYRLKENFYSRPTSDAAQFGEARMEEVCGFLTRQIDRGFIVPLREAWGIGKE
ncbi:MAG: hypothetical protein ABH883_02310 [Candidatus Omnitrophota bacterium]